MARVMVNDEKGLAEALKEGCAEIEIIGDFKDQVIRIRATEKFAWQVAFSAIAVAVIIVILTGGFIAPVAALFGSSAVTILGFPAALSAVMISVAAGGTASLNKLRSYQEVMRDDNRLVLHRK
jgi:hypothetical protein